MIKFTMDGKELKTMIEKAMTTIDKRIVLSSLTTVYFQIDQEKNLRIWGTNLKHYAEVFTDRAYNTSPGVIGVSVDDIKIITKMSGMVEFKELEEEKDSRSVAIKNGNKTIIIPACGNTDIFLPSMDDSEMEVLIAPENWMYETIDKLSIFTSDNEANITLNSINFNIEEGEVEAVDGYKLGTRKIEEKYIVADMTSIDPILRRNIKLHNMCVPVIRKLLNKKSNDKTRFSVDKKHIKISGKDFTYVARRVDGEYLKVNQLWHDYNDIHFTADKEEMIDVMKYVGELSKMDHGKYEKQIPVCLSLVGNNLSAYIKTKKYESMDTLVSDDIKWKDEFYICFDPNYLLDVLQVVDRENPVFRGLANNKTAFIIEGNEYKFLVLPVFDKGKELETNMRKFISKKVA